MYSVPFWPHLVCMLSFLGCSFTMRQEAPLPKVGFGSCACHSGHASHLGCTLSFLGCSHTLRHVAPLPDCLHNLNMRRINPQLPGRLVDSDHVPHWPRIASWLHVVFLRSFFQHATIDKWQHSGSTAHCRLPG